MWRSETKIEKRKPDIGFPEALQHEARSASGIYTFETFDAYQGFEQIYSEACEYAARKAFGHRFKGFNYGKPMPYLKGHDRTTVYVHDSLYIQYSGILDFMRTAEQFNKVFDAFNSALKEYIRSHYPDAKIYMQHGGCYKMSANFIIKIALTSRF